MFGGGSELNGSNASDVVDVLDTTTGTWSTAALSVRRFALAATSINNRIIFGGGATQAGVSDVVDMYQLLTSSVETISLNDFVMYPNPASTAYHH